jgi:uncharacterized membrane protein YbhN (UPF0104 family)
MRGDGGRRGSSRQAWTLARHAGAVLILGILVARLGTGPFLDGVRGLGPGTLLVALTIGGGTTLCSAWRWRVVSAALGGSLSMPAATAAYYRSQFLNTVLPGGVLGDVDRGVRHGLDRGDLGRGIRSVVWERMAGQMVQAALALVVLLTVPSPVHAAMPLVATGGVVAVALLLVAGRRLARHGRGRGSRGLRAAATEARSALLGPDTWPPVLLTSVLAVAGYAGMFLLAARAVGVHEAPPLVLPLAMIVLLAAAIPLNVAGWGAREGVAAWVFAAAGWGAGTGAAVATAFGVLTLVATLPGLVVLVVGSLRRGRTGTGREEAVVATAASVAAARAEGGTDG